MAINWRTIHIPFVTGLQTKSDPRALQLPSLAICRDVEFDELGGLQTRKPYALVSSSIVGGGTVTDFRRIVENGDELLLFTKSNYYSWSERDAAWLSRGSYPATKVTETATFARTGDQVFADRAELGGVACTVWTEITDDERIYVGATDIATGAVILSPTQITITSCDPTRPRVVALATKFLVVFIEDNNDDLLGFPLAPATMAADMAAANASSGPPVISIALATPFTTGGYDIITQGGVAWAAWSGSGGDYGIARITDALAVTRTTKARDGRRIALAITADGTQLFVVRYNGALIGGDRLNPTTLADISAGNSLGAPATATVNKITAAVQSVLSGGQYRCFVWWTCDESVDANDLSFVCETNYIDTASAVGTKRTFARRLGLASHAFAHSDGRVYVWLVFAGESAASGMGDALGIRAALQNTYFLFRDSTASVSAGPIAKAAGSRAGGFGWYAGHLPSVQQTSTNVYEWCGIERRIIPLGANQTGYAARVPRAISLEFDANEARRVVRLGLTAYITGGQIVQYDGEGYVEVGFHVFPWFFGGVATGFPVGALPTGAYSYKSTYRWPNAKGELDRSTTATGTQIPVTLGQCVEFQMVNLYVTLKHGSRGAPAVEIWRTLADPPLDAPFHLITDQSPGNLTNPNRYLANDPSASLAATFQDTLSDDDLAGKETNPENGGILENLAPPSATIIAATQDRLLLAGISDRPNQVCYSKLRGDADVAAFHEALVFDLPPDGGPITALSFLNETLIVFKGTAIYAVPGDGYDNAGGGQNYGPARIIAQDVGAVSHEAVAITPKGILFHSRKGWYLLNQGWAAVYVGGPVADFDSDTFVAVHLLESQHHVRCVSAARVLTWDFLADSWSEWTVTGGLGAVVWQGRHLVVTAAGVLEQRDTHDGSERVALDIETAPLKLADLAGFQRVRSLELVGEYRSAHRVRIRLARDYAAPGVYFEDKIWTVSPTTVGGPLQVRHGPSIQKSESLRVRITAMDAALDSAPAGEALRVTGIGLEVGVKRGLFRGLPAAQKQ